jgi:ribose transport system ATP-binding protein
VIAQGDRVDGTAGAHAPAVSVHAISKAFAATQALDDVSFEIGAGKVHALLGENGSGKSTLVKILAGVYHADEGTLTCLGQEQDATGTTPAGAEELGLRFVHQSPSTFPKLTVAENMAIGAAFPTRMGGIRWPRLRARTSELLERYKIDAHPDTLLGDLRPADQTMVAIARALRDSAERTELVLVLDEPTAALPEQEVELLLSALRHCVSIGHTIVYVSHRIEEVLSIADAVTVLRDGRHVITRPAAGLGEGELVGHIIGRPLSAVYPRGAATSSGTPRLEVSGLTAGPLNDVSLVARRGEIVGLAGLLGSGRTELLLSIFGAYPRDAGEVKIDGQARKLSSPTEAIAAGIGYVPEDRHADASFPNLTVRENIGIARLGRYWRGMRFRHRQERQEAQGDIGRFRIRTGGQEELFSSLSGGNQQKAVLARWLSLEPVLLLLDEPTQGVDIGARGDTYEAIRAAVDRGMTALLVTSDFEEMAQVADRVLILRDGRIRTELTGADIDRHRIAEGVYSSNGGSKQ